MSVSASARQLEHWHALEASAWIETLRCPKPGDEARFVSWLKESPRNVRDFLLMLSVEQSLDRLDAARRHDLAALLEQVSSVVPAPRSAATVARRRRAWRWAVAAGVLVALSALLLDLTLQASRWRTYETEVGEQRAFDLEDGSIVHLNTHSRIAVRLGTERREVRLLQGEALFRVHHEPARPFLVSTDDAVVRAVGTEFDVYRRDDGTVVAVLEGRVNVTPTASEAPQPTPPPSGARPVRSATSRSLSASEEARISHAGTVSVRAVGNVGDAVAWQERRLVFEQESLARIVEEFNRYRRIPIRLEGESVRDRIYSGIFDADDADSLVEVLEHDPALEVERTPGEIRVALR